MVKPKNSRQGYRKRTMSRDMLFFLIGRRLVTFLTKMLKRRGATILNIYPNLFFVFIVFVNDMSPCG